VPTARIILDPEKQPLPSENVHVWENTRNSSKAENIDALTLSIVETACPEWNAFRTCSGAVLSTFDAELKAGITMYPNPVNDVLYIKGDKVSSINQVYINSLHGKELYKAVADNLDLGIDVSTLPNGLYIITLVTDWRFALVSKLESLVINNFSFAVPVSVTILEYENFFVFWSKVIQLAMPFTPIFSSTLIILSLHRSVLFVVSRFLLVVCCFK